jgi:hypothetical protein
MSGIIEWRPVVGWEGLYDVSSDGRVRSLRRGGRELKLSAHYSGYLSVRLSLANVGVTRLIHHLVAEAFIGPRPDGMQVCHWDDDPSNNGAGNLRYATPRDNQLDAVRNGRNASAKRTSCPSGHPLAGDNLTVRKNGKRMCKSCHRARWHQYKARLSEGEVVHSE